MFLLHLLRELRVLRAFALKSAPSASTTTVVRRFISSAERLNISSVDMQRAP